jgi:CheY-like chemotaxis protein
VKQLRDLGYNVLQASTGEAALEFLRTDTHVDLLLTDIVMPGGLNGYELAREALKTRPDLKLLYTSGFPEAAFGRESELRPGDLLLGKPYRRDELAQSVREALAAPPAA